MGGRAGSKDVTCRLACVSSSYKCRGGERVRMWTPPIYIHVYRSNTDLGMSTLYLPKRRGRAFCQKTTFSKERMKHNYGKFCRGRWASCQKKTPSVGFLEQQFFNF